MTQEFIKYEQALALKELGFDERTLTLWHKDKTEELITLPHKGILYGYSNSLDAPWLTAPTFSQAFRWFREKHKINIQIAFCEYAIESCNSWKFTFNNPTGNQYWNGEFKTYEEAEQACLEKLIEIVKNN